MATEIERKFKVQGDFKSQAINSLRIIQGYISSAADRSVRIRVKGDEGFITIKGAGSPSGLSRYEWEKIIPTAEALELIKLCEPGLIEKTRYLVKFKNHTFEVDEFHGGNEGLIIAEIELETEDEAFEKPDWLGEEVTGDIRYYNAFLAKRPFKDW